MTFRTFGKGLKLPSVIFRGAARDEEAGDDPSVLLVASHPVSDYARWRSAYDAGRGLRARGGVRSDEVFQNAEDPNLVVVLHRFDTLEEARAFCESEELKAAMDEAGVTSPPEITLAVTPPDRRGARADS